MSSTGHSPRESSRRQAHGGDRTSVRQRTGVWCVFLAPPGSELVRHAAPRPDRGNFSAATTSRAESTQPAARPLICRGVQPALRTPACRPIRSDRLVGRPPQREDRRHRLARHPAADAGHPRRVRVVHRRRRLLLPPQDRGPVRGGPARHVDGVPDPGGLDPHAAVRARRSATTRPTWWPSWSSCSPSTRCSRTRSGGPAGVGTTRPSTSGSLFVFLVGPLSYVRFDMIPAVLAGGALLAARTRPWVAGALTGLGAAIKLWPALLIPALLADKERRKPTAIGFVVVGFGLALISLVTGGLTRLFSPLTWQSGRGLQIESIWADPADAAADGPSRAVGGRDLPLPGVRDLRRRRGSVADRQQRGHRARSGDDRGAVGARVPDARWGHPGRGRAGGAGHRRPW